MRSCARRRLLNDRKPCRPGWTPSRKTIRFTLCNRERKILFFRLSSSFSRFSPSSSNCEYIYIVYIVHQALFYRYLCDERCTMTSLEFEKKWRLRFVYYFRSSRSRVYLYYRLDNNCIRFYIVLASVKRRKDPKYAMYIHTHTPHTVFSPQRGGNSSRSFKRNE